MTTTRRTTTQRPTTVTTKKLNTTTRSQYNFKFFGAVYSSSQFTTKKAINILTSTTKSTSTTPKPSTTPFYYAFTSKTIPNPQTTKNPYIGDYYILKQRTTKNPYDFTNFGKTTVKDNYNLNNNFLKSNYFTSFFSDSSNKRNVTSFMFKG